MAEKIKKLVKKKRKRWIPIVSPKEFGSLQMGETLAIESKELLGKDITLSLMALNNDIKRQYINLTFKIKEIKEDSAITEIKAYKLSMAHVKRLIKRAKSKVEDSYILKTKDNPKVRIKVLVLTKNKTCHSVLTALRKKTKELLTIALEKGTFEELIQQMITYNLQKSIYVALKKVYPISNFDIRVFKKE